MLEEVYRINWKKNIKNPPDAHYFFKSFSGWIPESPEVFVDVADYKHVQDGPAVYLSGHYEDYTYDLCDNQPGLLYRRRKPLEGSLEEKLAATLSNFIKRAESLAQGEESVHYDNDKITLIFNDRAFSPNTAEVFSQVKPKAEAAVEKALGRKAKAVKHVSAGRSNRRLELEISL